MNDFNIRITRREGDVEHSIDIDCYAPKPRGVLVAEGIATALAVAAAVGIPAVAPLLEWSNTLCDGKRVNHAAAEKACAALGKGWRLPTRAELLSLVDDTRSEPAIDTARFPDTQSGAYWTGTPLASDSSCAWVVYFSYGYALNFHSDLAFVRAVRASPAGQ